MKILVFGLLAFLGVSMCTGRAQPANAPLTRDQVADLVKFGMDSSELAARIKERGIDFLPTAEVLEELRKVGAPELVLQALRNARPAPLTRDQVGQLVAGQVPSQRATNLVNERGIDFVADDQYLDTLRVAGADDTLIAALRTATDRVRVTLRITTLPQANIYLNGAPQGQADAAGELVLHIKPGTYALKVTRQGSKDFEQNVTLKPGTEENLHARLEPKEKPALTTRTNPRDHLAYLWIPPGTFQMGCSAGDAGCFPNEQPAHPVTISKGFWMGQTSLTVGAYKNFAGATGRRMPMAPPWDAQWAQSRAPMVSVSWDDAHGYCEWAGGRLPTEAEWEYAARGGNPLSRYGPLDDIAWYAANSGGQTHDVAQKRQNAFGLFDMLGNVWNWVNDWYDPVYYQNSPPQDPTGPVNGSERVDRGLSWNYEAARLRVSFRGFIKPGLSYNYVGFRCALDED